MPGSSGLWLGKLCRESKFIFSTTWKAVTCRVLKVIWKYMVVLVIYTSLYIGGAKSCRYPTLLHISSWQRDWESVRSSSKRDRHFSVVRERHFMEKRTTESRGKTDILSSQTEMPNAVKTTCWILLVQSEPRDGNRIFSNSNNFINKAEETNLQINVSITKIRSCLPYTI